MEHRWGKRVVVDVPFRLVGGAFSGRSARLTNLSVSGGCVRSSFEPRLLSHIELAIELPQRFMHAVPRLTAYVTRTFKGGVGIEWCEFAPPLVGELIRSATPRRYGYSRRSLTPAAMQPRPDGTPAGAQPSPAPQPFAPATHALLKHGT